MNSWKLAGGACAWSSLRAMVCALALFHSIATNLSPFAQARKSENQDTYTIRGTVVNSVTHTAVARALVFSTDNRFAKLTDDEGHFEFKVPRPQAGQNPGSQTFYSAASSKIVTTPTSIVFLARKPGYFQSLTGEPWMGGEAESSAEIKIELVPEALIVGRVNLPANDGTDKIRVQIYRRQVQEGRRQWAPAGFVSCRVNGEFRFASLREGEYKLFTQELLDRDPLTFDPRGQLFGYPPVYYPRAADFESAAVIHLKAGETFSATLTPSRREYYRVKLGVTNAEAGGGIGVDVQSQGHRGPGFSLRYNMNESSIEGTLPNGNYSVVVTAFGENAATGVLNFSVSGAPVQGPSVMLVPNQLIAARVKDERTKGDGTIAQGARNLLGAMNVRFIPSEEFGQWNFLWLRPPKDPEDESLVFGNVHPASYRVRAGCNPMGYVAAVSSGGRDLLRQPLVVGIGAAVPPIEITIRDDGAQVQGSIENWPPQGRKELNFSGNLPAVVLLPLPDSLGQFCQAWATPTGEFSFPQVPPGDYRALAFEHMPEELEYDDAEAIKKYESKARMVRLVAGQNERLRLALNTGSE